MTTTLLAAKKIHFVGIGGIGISAIAKMLLAEGKTVSGSDRGESLITKELSTLGVDVKIGHDAKNIPADCDLVIYTIAITAENPELVEAQRRACLPAKQKIKLLTYPQALGLISAAKKTIAISGTHGKTTTTAMIAKILVDAKLDPTVIVGSLMFGDGSRASGILGSSASAATNFIAGKGEYLIVEACEYRRSFLNLSPQILVITNIDNDHLDYYKDLDDIKSAFAEMSAKVPADGKIITEKEYDKIALPIKLLVPGTHNQKNAQAAIAVALAVGISEEAARKSLETFAGTWRRFEFKGKTKEGALVYDDYAHHPAEIKATLAGAREMLNTHFPQDSSAPSKIIAIFQPHLYSRTKLLLADFATSFKDASEVILLPIYAAREPFDRSISSEVLAEAIRQTGTPAQAFSDFDAVLTHLTSLTSSASPYSTSNLQSASSTLILTIGAGNIFELAPSLL